MMHLEPEPNDQNETTKVSSAAKDLLFQIGKTHSVNSVKFIKLIKLSNPGQFIPTTVKNKIMLNA
jgi:hypothetical protein